MKSISYIATLAIALSSACATGDPAGQGTGDEDSEAMAELLALVGSEFRTIDGTNNNIDNPEFGSAHTPLLRFSRPSYEDGLSSPSGFSRASARAVSNGLAAQSALLPNPQGASDYLWAWGQFLDHDVDISEGASPAEAFNIAVPAGDPHFDPNSTGTQIIPLNRSIFEDDADGVRQQINEISSFIDASNVYGSDPVRADALRTLDGTGRLKTGPGNLLPKNTDGLPNAQPGGAPAAAFFLAGDVRANEVSSLIALHTLFVREHNRLVALMSSLVPELDGEDLYQLARRLVGAEIQAITYREFLPVLLGAELGAYTGYRDEVNASIANEFSTAAYRVGHTMLSPTIRRIDASGDEVAGGHLPLQGAFFAPSIIENGGIDSVLRGLGSQRCQSIDSLVVDDVRNFLFGPPGAGGFDLASLNIQRGRDHGLASYNDTRRDYGLGGVSSFSEISSNPAVASKLEAMYGSVEDIDLWVGGLSEDPVPGAMVGEVFAAILGDQFTRLRSGDRFWYETMPASIVDLVNSLTLAEIIRLNTDVGSEMANNVFAAPSGSGEPGKLMINEVLADPAPLIDANGDGTVSSTQDEFIELVNTGGSAIDLSGAIYADAVGDRFTFPAGVSVEPGQALLVFGGGAPNPSDFAGVVVVVANGSLALNNSGDAVSITSASGDLLAAATFGGANDQSLTRELELNAAANFIPHTDANNALRASPGTTATGGAL